MGDIINEISVFRNFSCISAKSKTAVVKIDECSAAVSHIYVSYILFPVCFVFGHVKYIEQTYLYGNQKAQN